MSHNLDPELMPAMREIVRDPGEPQARKLATNNAYRIMEIKADRMISMHQAQSHSPEELQLLARIKSAAKNPSQQDYNAAVHDLQLLQKLSTTVLERSEHARDLARQSLITAVVQETFLNINWHDQMKANAQLQLQNPKAIATMASEARDLLERNEILKEAVSFDEMAEDRLREIISRCKRPMTEEEQIDTFNSLMLYKVQAVNPELLNTLDKTMKDLAEQSKSEEEYLARIEELVGKIIAESRTHEHSPEASNTPVVVENFPRSSGHDSLQLSGQFVTSPPAYHTHQQNDMPKPFLERNFGIHRGYEEGAFQKLSQKAQQHLFHTLGRQATYTESLAFLEYASPSHLETRPLLVSSFILGTAVGIWPARRQVARIEAYRMLHSGSLLGPWRKRFGIGLRAGGYGMVCFGVATVSMQLWRSKQVMKDERLKEYRFKKSGTTWFM